MATGYRGRFAPSPTGPLHAGSLVAALASWLDARAHGGAWLVRIEDVDTPRCVSGAEEIIMRQLADCGLIPDEKPLRQSARGTVYQHALDQLLAGDRVYPCACSRKDIELALAAAGHPHLRHGELVYPGTCRGGLRGRSARAWRFRARPGMVQWHDARLQVQAQDVAHDVGDFVLKRADGLWAYQLAVVVDDARQGITDVVRGEDLADNTARQIQLQETLAYTRPRYLHTPLALGANGEKLSKQSGARPVDTADPLAVLNSAARTLLLAPHAGPVHAALAAWVAQWRDFYNRAGD